MIQQHRLLPSQLRISPQARVWGLAFISVMLFASVARYYFTVTPLLAAVPAVVYVLGILLVVMVPFSTSYNRLLLVHAYVTLPLTLPLALPLPSGFFIYLSNLVVLFFNSIIYHGEIKRQRLQVPSLQEYVLMLIGGIISGGLVAALCFRYVSAMPLPLLLAVAGGCVFRPQIIEPVFPQPPSPSSWIDFSLTRYMPSWISARMEVWKGRYPVLGRVIAFSTWLYGEAMKLRGWKERVKNSALMASIPQQYRKLAAIGSFTLLLIVLAACYRHIVPLVGTKAEYWVNIYMIAYTAIILITCFSFRSDSRYLGISIAVSTLVSLLFLSRFGGKLEVQAIGGMDLSVERLMLISALFLSFSIRSPVLYSIRNAYGQVEVKHNRMRARLDLVNNGILHGAQFYDEDARNSPTTYYGKQGPFGQLFTALQDDPRSNEVAVIGLGAGTIAAYGRAGQAMTFYEINPAVQQIASDMGYFTYLQESKAATKVVIGDAREKLALASDASLGIIIGDAYNGPNVPRHLLTREAFALYAQKLVPNGLLIMDIANIPLQLLQSVTRAAAEAGMTGLYRQYTPVRRPTGLFAATTAQPVRNAGLIPTKKSGVGGMNDPLATAFLEKLEEGLALIGIRAEEERAFDAACSWAVLARSKEDMAMILQDARWKPLPAGSPDRSFLTDEECGYEPWANVLRPGQA